MAQSVYARCLGRLAGAQRDGSRTALVGEDDGAQPGLSIGAKEMGEHAHAAVTERLRLK